MIQLVYYCINVSSLYFYPLYHLPEDGPHGGPTLFVCKNYFSSVHFVCITVILYIFNNALIMNDVRFTDMLKYGI